MTTHFIPTDIIHNVSKYKRLSTEIFLLVDRVGALCLSVKLPPFEYGFYIFILFPMLWKVQPVKSQKKKKKGNLLKNIGFAIQFELRFFHSFSFFMFIKKTVQMKIKNKSFHEQNNGFSFIFLHFYYFKHLSFLFFVCSEDIQEYSIENRT